MPSEVAVPRRADARRNRERILDAATEVFRAEGPQAPLEAVARRAGVSPATLFRHVAGRDELVALVVERRFAAELEPALAAAAVDPDPWAGLVTAIEAAVRVGTSTPGWRATVARAREAGLIAGATRDRFRRATAALLARAQAAGVARADVTRDDLVPIIRMLRALAVEHPVTSRGTWMRALELLLRPPA